MGRLLFVGDHFRVTNTFTLDLGLRYERIGQFGDNLGRSSSFDVNAAIRIRQPAGASRGMWLPANYTGPLPSGVIRAGNDAGTSEKGRMRSLPESALPGSL